MHNNIKYNNFRTSLKTLLKRHAEFISASSLKTEIPKQSRIKSGRNDDYQFLKMSFFKNISLNGMFFVFLILLPLFSNCQNDSIKNDSIKIHNPRLATLMSTFVPGSGQVYNKKYWKVPIIYVGLGALVYMAHKSNVNYKKFRYAYLTMYKDPTKPQSYKMDGMEFTLNGLETGKNYYRRYRDLFVIFSAGLYLMNIIDANVDANLYDFDISDNLSLRIEPTPIYIGMNKTSMGIKIVLNF